MSDLRTKAGRREEILDHVRQHGGFSAFWATENPLRARMLEQMCETGELDTDPLGYPFVAATIAKP